jgi:hypothetical protein
MKDRVLKKFVVGIYVLVLLLSLSVSVFAQGPSLISHAVTGSAPTINGSVGQGEWPGAPQIIFNGAMTPTPGYTYVIPTYVYFCNDLTYIYVLVDAVGDATSDAYDECLLIFGNGNDYILTEGFGDGNSCPQGVTFASGFGASPNSATNHRIYEWRVPLSEINANPGQMIDFCSPHNSKYLCLFPTGNPGGSLGYDETTGNDNIWPPGLIEVNDMTNREAWGRLQLQPTDRQSVPTLSEWGIILMGLFLAGAAIWTMKRKLKFSM